MPSVPANKGQEHCGTLFFALLAIRAPVVQRAALAYNSHRTPRKEAVAPRTCPTQDPWNQR